MHFKRLRSSKKVLIGGVLTVAVIAGAATMAVGSITSGAQIPLAPQFTAAQLNAYAGNDWITNGGDIKNDRYSSLTQISPSNVGTLKQAWATDLGVCPTHNSACGSEEATPIEYGGVMYYQTPKSDVFALDATTGQVLWHYAPVFDPGFSIGTGGREPGVAIGDGLIFAGQKDGNLVALNQQTGKVVWKTSLMPWQKGGSLDEAPLYYDGMVIEGTSGADGGSLSNTMEAVNANTGEILWTWNVVPQAAGALGANTWSFNGAITGSQYGGGAMWQTPALDSKDGLVIFGTGNPVPWNSRGPGSNLFTDSIVALNVFTGQMQWYYQTVHHDLWDSDLPNNAVLFNAKMPTGWQSEPTTPQTKASVPKLAKATVAKAKGKKKPKAAPATQNVLGVAMVAKLGWTWLLDAKTGKPLEKIDQVSVPQSTAPSVNTWPVQPIPQTPNVIDDLKMPNGQGRLCARPQYWTQLAPDGHPYKVGCIFDAYDTTQFVVAPFEEMDWPSSSYDPLTKGFETCGVSNRAFGKEQIPTASQVIGSKGGIGAGILSVSDNAQNNWGNFSSLNVTTNKFNWHQAWGTPCYSGEVNTASGITFVGHIGPGNGQSGQGYLEAQDSKTGASLWTSPPMTAPATSPPITYEVNGVQYVAIMAGGEAHDDPTGAKRGDTIYTFALG
jgi:quinohemoprotein ethanol dehydrogenase